MEYIHRRSFLNFITPGFFGKTLGLNVNRAVSFYLVYVLTFQAFMEAWIPIKIIIIGTPTVFLVMV